MKHELAGGVADALDPHYPRVALEQDRDRCCVGLAPADDGPAEDGQ